MPAPRPAIIEDVSFGTLHEMGCSDVEGVRIIDEEIALHIKTGGDARGCIPGSLKTVTRIRGDPARVHQSHRVEHGTSIFIQDHLIAHSIADYLQANPLRFEGCGVGAVMVALDRGGIHEVEFDEADSPFADNFPVSFPHIRLGSGMGCVQRIKHIRLLVPDKCQ